MADTGGLSDEAAAAVAADVAAAAAAAAAAVAAAAAAATTAVSPPTDHVSLPIAQRPPQPHPPVTPPASSVVQLYTPAVHGHLVLYLAALHGSCITHDGLTGSFVPPLHHEKLLAWWKVRLASSTVLLWLLPTSDPDSAVVTARPAASDLVGAAMLHGHPAETSPHVAAVDLLLVSPRQRSQGGERLLLAAVQQHALAAGRTLLTAETDADSPAAHTFLDLGFTLAGRIPNFVVRSNGETRDQLLLYKNLAPS